MTNNRHHWLTIALGMAFLTVFTSPTMAQTLDLTLNNSAVAIDYSARMSDSELNLGAGFIHNEDKGDAYYASLFVADNVNMQSNFLAGVGGRIYYVEEDKFELSGIAVGVGGFLNWEIPAAPLVSVRADFYFAPDVIAYEDLSGLMDFSARIQYRIIERAWVYLGYRTLEVSPLEDEGPDRKIDDSANVGIMIWF